MKKVRLSQTKVEIPLDVPLRYKKTYLSNFLKATHKTGNLMLFAGDQKVEHLNDDFFGKGIAKEDNDPEHLFKIASKARIGVFATQWGLIAKYGKHYPTIPYLIKINSKTHLVHTSQKDPVSTLWIEVPDIAELRKISKLSIVGVGYTIYLGSEFESSMLSEAARICREAHKYGLLTVIWIYPRGKAVPDEKDPHLIAGAAGVAATLGADFVKVNYPKKEGIDSAEALKEAVVAAGKTKLLCAGGSSVEAQKFFQTLHDQIHISGASGNATGRNIHQRPLDEAVRFCNAIAAITLDNQSVTDALKLYKG